jgi:hypothetical protein
VLTTRDFHNWLACQVRYHEKTRMAIRTNAQVNRLIRMRIAYTGECLGRTGYLAIPGLVRVSYNRWVSESDYRLDLVEGLAIAVRNNDISYVPGAGGGSSSDATDFSRRSTEMRTNDRRHYLQNERFRRLLDCVKTHLNEIEIYICLLKHDLVSLRTIKYQVEGGEPMNIVPAPSALRGG